MSASLVGSEMCIRDRGKLLGFRLADLRPGVRGVRRAALRLRGAPAVSYTHVMLPTICSV
eukprot:60215-Alexandrium_andersonii.AAC.1